VVVEATNSHSDYFTRDLVAVRAEQREALLVYRPSAFTVLSGLTYVVKRDEVRRQVLAAIERGEIPPGGPGELAALDLLDAVPAGYWERWSEQAAERIRRQSRESDGVRRGRDDGQGGDRR
jgi:hypothetical protein